jgi:hypothetical protein
MSLQDLLNSYSQEITAQVAHNSAVAQDNADRKASTINEIYNHAKEQIEGIGGEIAGLGAGYHLGRKLYKKYQEKYGEKKAKNPASNENDNMGEDEETEEGGGEGSATGNEQTPTEESSSGASANDVEDPEADQAVEALNQQATDASGNVPPAEQQPAVEGIDEELVQGLEQRAEFENGKSQSLSNQLDDARGRVDEFRQSGLSADQKPLDVELAENDVSELPAQIAEQQQRATQATQQAQSARSNLNSQQTNSDLADAQHQSAVAQGDADARVTAPPEGEPVPPPASDSSEITNSITQASNDARDGISSARGLTGTMSDGFNAVKEAVGNGAKQLVSKAGSLLPEGADLSGLATTEGVLDALGPIGEIGGAIVGLVGLFEGLFHKPKAPTVTKADTQLQVQAGGIDTTALAQKQQVVGAVV